MDKFWFVILVVGLTLNPVNSTNASNSLCVNTFNPITIKQSVIRFASGSSFKHLGYPDIVRYKGNLFIAYREAPGTDTLYGSHFIGPSVIVILKMTGNVWHEVARIRPPSPATRPAWPVTIFDDDIYQTDDIRDFTFSTTSDGRLMLNLGVVNSIKRVSLFGIEKIQLSAVTFSNDGQNWEIIQFTDSPYQYMLFNTKLYIGKNYGFAYLTNYIKDHEGNIKNFNQGGLVLLSSSNGVNYSLLPSLDGEAGTLYNPYLQQVVLTSRMVEGEEVFFTTGANETDLHIYSDGSAIVLARIRDRENTYYTGFAQNVRGPWSFKKVEGVAGIHAPAIEVLPSGKVVAAYRRVLANTLDANTTYDYCTVISVLNPVSGKLSEIVTFAGLNTFDIGYPGILVDGNNLLITYHETSAEEFPLTLYGPILEAEYELITEADLTFRARAEFSGSSKLIFAIIPLTELNKRIGKATGSHEALQSLQEIILQ